MALPPLKKTILGPYSGSRWHRSTRTMSGHTRVLDTVILTVACFASSFSSSEEDRSVESENDSSFTFLDNLKDMLFDYSDAYLPLFLLRCQCGSSQHKTVRLLLAFSGLLSVCCRRPSWWESMVCVTLLFS
jgi:hypothetical protein